MAGITARTRRSLADTEAALRDALAAHGFGVLTEIDIAATFKAKLDIDRAPLKILGACNPQLAHRALEADADAALVLPCNVVLQTTDQGTVVTAADPHDIITNPDLAALADEAADKLRAALEIVDDSSDEAQPSGD